MVCLASSAVLGCSGAAKPGTEVRAVEDRGGGENKPGHEEACKPENRGQGSGFACSYDSECAVCHDGSDCGVPMSLIEIEARGEACEKQDAADCEPTTPRCCNGRCVIAGWMYVEPVSAEESPMQDEPPCHGQDCFGDYQPKTSPDTLVDFAPQVIQRVDEIASADLDGLPALIHALFDAKSQAAKNPGTVRQGNVILGADPEEYVPSEQELLECAIGDRIAQVIAANDGERVAAALKKAGIEERSLTYGKIDVWHVDVMGSGRFFYASKPAPTAIDLPR
jgi:hypothetical protein